MPMKPQRNLRKEGSVAENSELFQHSQSLEDSIVDARYRFGQGQILQIGAVRKGAFADGLQSLGQLQHRKMIMEFERPIADGLHGTLPMGSGMER